MGIQRPDTVGYKLGSVFSQGIGTDQVREHIARTLRMEQLRKELVHLILREYLKSRCRKLGHYLIFRIELLGDSMQSADIRCSRNEIRYVIARECTRIRWKTSQYALQPCLTLTGCSLSIVN